MGKMLWRGIEVQTTAAFILEWICAQISAATFEGDVLIDGTISRTKPFMVSIIAFEIGIDVIIPLVD